MDRIEFFRHNIGPREIRDLNRVLRGLFLTTGKEVERFEREFARYLSLPHAVGLTSCTAALQLSLTGLGIGPGDEVITTPLTFAATSLAILQAGAVPVLADVEPDTGNIDPEQVENAVTGRTRAILPVHLYGLMCDMKRLSAIAGRLGLVIVEDAAHALEASREGVRAGELGDSACFSFYPTKSITCGEGGAAATRHGDLDRRLRLLRHHGMDSTATERYGKDELTYDIQEMGWKYNMDNIQAALLHGQLERAGRMHEKRSRLAARYCRELAGTPGIELPAAPESSVHAWHLYAIRVPADRRTEFIRELTGMGIGLSVNYTPVHRLSFFREKFGYAEGDFPVAESIGARTVSLPLYPSLGAAEAGRVISAVRNTAEKLRFDD